MKTIMRRVALAGLLLACAAAGVGAAEPQPAPDERQAFSAQQKTARLDFRRKLDQDRKVFYESLKGKSREEQRPLRAQFKAKQKAERAAFNKSQQEQRRAFSAAHPPRGRSHRARQSR
ncbi:MAG: hypothetical protein PHU21_07420 [Elusimicrobia bacterium]|nr:hypothetical protein [Elusimicrobiota bacterium]